MKVGSLVVCINDSNIPNRVNYLNKGSIYTVINIRKYGKGVGICVEEIDKKCNIRFKNGGINRNVGIPYSINRFELIDTPTSISIEEFLKEKV